MIYLTKRKWNHTSGNECLGGGGGDCSSAARMSEPPLIKSLSPMSYFQIKLLHYILHRLDTLWLEVNYNIFGCTYNY